MLTWLTIRILLALLLFVIAAHGVFTLSSMLSWYLTLAATEMGHWLAVVSCLVAVPGADHEGWISWSGTALLVLAILAFCVPVVQARRIAQGLRERTPGARDDAAAGAPFSIVGLFCGGRPTAVPERMSYDPAGDAARRINFFRASSAAPAPCLVVIHGGGWESGDPEAFADWNAHWARLGYAVAAISYRLAPEHAWPAQREDVELALRHLKMRAGDLGIDPERFVLVGRSAGGQIATACAYGLGDPAVRGVISIYGPSDMFFARSISVPDDLLNSLRLVLNFMGGEPDDAPKNYVSASGLLLADARSCPAFIIHGARDTLVWDLHSRRLASRLADLGVKHQLIELPWATHGFDWFYRGPGSQLLRHASDRFLADVCRQA